MPFQFGYNRAAALLEYTGPTVLSHTPRILIIRVTKQVPKLLCFLKVKEDLRAVGRSAMCDCGIS